MARAPRDIERIYATTEVVAKLRRLADALEKDDSFRIQVAGVRIRVPERAQFSIEHELGDDEEEIEFQLKWPVESEASRDSDDDHHDDQSSSSTKPGQPSYTTQEVLADGR